MTVVLLVLALASLAALAWWIRSSIGERNVWSVGIYFGDGADPVRLVPHPQASQPVLAASDVTDIEALGIADPFMIRRGGRWHMFVEVINASGARGEIALATSDDGVRWRYERVVLREPFHVSYPQVFAHGDACYMIPESRRANAVRLYRAEPFPHRWRLVREMLVGNYRDASILHHDGRWWLFALRGRRELTLHVADRLEGPWSEHPRSPLAVDEPRRMRPGGRVIADGGRLLRFAQDGETGYGTAVRAFEIVRLTPMEYLERELQEAPILAASGAGWNAHGMHHADLHRDDEGRWIACVDGKRIARCFKGRKGARRIVDTLLAAFARHTPVVR